MGADIHSFAEVRKNGKWVMVEEPCFDGYDQKTTAPFKRRNYSVFGFLAGVRGWLTPISDPKGLPDDSEYLNTQLDKPERCCYSGYDNGTAYTNKGKIECDIDYHSCSWLTLKELLDFDYEREVFGRTITRRTTFPNRILFKNMAEKEDDGQIITYRWQLGEGFFKDLGVLKTLGKPEDVRVVFWFDN